METPNPKGTIGMAAKIVTGFFAVLLLLEAIAASLFVPEYEDVLYGLGADLPLVTELILASVYWVWLLPLSAITLIYLGKFKNKSNVLPVVFIFVLGVIYLPATFYGLYLPVWELAEVQAQ